MKALVVFESMFGNSEQVARSIAEGLGGRLDVDVVNVRDAPASAVEGADVLVVGGPTHAFSMTRANTREDAVRQGASAGAAGTGIREWIEGLGSGPHAEVVATFDTRVAKVRHLPGSAAKSAARALRKHGFRNAVTPESFYVDDVSGPVLPGELDRARDWGDRLARRLVGQASAH